MKNSTSLWNIEARVTRVHWSMISDAALEDRNELRWLGCRRCNTYQTKRIDKTPCQNQLNSASRLYVPRAISRVYLTYMRHLLAMCL